MSNDSKSANVNDRGGSGQNDSNRPNDTAQNTGQQSQDATRHQQDASHHENTKTPQQDGSDSKRGQQSQGGSQKDGSAMKPAGSTPNDRKKTRNAGLKIGSSK
jgi:hypothetical protein